MHIFAYTAGELAILIPLVISSVVGGLVTVISAIKQRSDPGIIRDIKEAVDTKNELSVGQLQEAQETRRIVKKLATGELPITAREKRHVDASEERSTGA